MPLNIDHYFTNFMRFKPIQKYFWEIDLEKVDMRQCKQYIIERILEMGDERAIRWLRKNFSPREIKETLRKSRRISSRSLNYWHLILQEK